MAKAKTTLHKRTLLQDIKRTWMLYLFLLPAFIYLIIFNYAPMYGIQIAFRNYNALDGVWGSTWVGLEHINKFIHSYQFMDLLKNTLILSVYSLVAGALKFHSASLHNLRTILLKPRKLIQSSFPKRNTKFLAFELLLIRMEETLFYRIYSIR